MATGFVITAAEVVTSALRKLGVLTQGEAATATEQAEGLLALNVMVGHFFTLGLPFYREYQHTITNLVAGQSDYTVSPDSVAPLGGVWGVYQAFLRDKNNQIDIPLRVVSRDEYNTMTNKTQQGTPVMVAMSPDGNIAKLYLTPDVNAALNKSVVLHGYKQEEVITSGASPVFPREWGEALIYGLCVRLAPEYGVPLDYTSKLERQAEAYLADAIMWNPQPTSIYFGAAEYGYS